MAAMARRQTFSEVSLIGRSPDCDDDDNGVVVVVLMMMMMMSIFIIAINKLLTHIILDFDNNFYIYIKY